MPNQHPSELSKPPVLGPPEDTVSPNEIRIRRRAALEKAKDQGVLTLNAEEGQWLGHRARVAAETGTHEIPDLAARRAAVQTATPPPERPHLNA